MAIEHIMIIFELTYDIHHSAIVDYRNKLVIHAKRVWYSFDSVSKTRRSRGGLSLLLLGLRQRGKREMCQRSPVTILKMRGQRIPAGLKNFLGAHKLMSRYVIGRMVYIMYCLYGAETSGSLYIYICVCVHDKGHIY